VAVVHDFPIGVDPDGADAWAWQDVLATGASVGAPPDRFNRRGQDWGLPPFIPHRLRARRYEPIMQTIRGAFRHGGGLRIDHVMGLFRLFWVPRGAAPTEGAYVRYRADELLAIIALESQRAGAFVVGEDLGTVERGVRERLAALGVLSTRVLWFESAPPRTWPELALATATTHDLPTVAGLWSGADLAAQRRLGLEPNADAFAENRRRLAALSGVSEDGRAEDVIAGTYRALAAAPSTVVTATLDDALAVEERPNMPGTTREWPNWSLALPVPIETLEEAPLARTIASALASRAVSQTSQEIRSRSA
jgi:4-alpha-glucanotransferase